MRTIKDRRVRMGFTQQQLADCLGIERTVYLRIENGTRIPKVNLAIRLAMLLDVPVEVLFGVQS